jgi:hypothetical protein
MRSNGASQLQHKIVLTPVTKNEQTACLLSPAFFIAGDFYKHLIFPINGIT